jgi:hypothetical protein
MHNRRVMGDARKLAVLSDVSEHLKHAQHDLLSAGYGLWIDDLLHLMETITLEMEWLAREGDDHQAAAG